ncbi:hypothetical protein BURMUCGD2M_5742 [Burkholderia multivorans CGD2M]|nr:hypothetical protein BURMUCGD2M_5742 [Burkholderia multivorans CGD2M]
MRIIRDRDAAQCGRRVRERQAERERRAARRCAAARTIAPLPLRTARSMPYISRCDI